MRGNRGEERRGKRRGAKKRKGRKGERRGKERKGEDISGEEGKQRRVIDLRGHNNREGIGDMRENEI
jgi:hypothetical protein